MVINWSVLSKVQEREQQAFWRSGFGDLTHHHYVPGEPFFVDKALSASEYDSDIYALVLGQNPGAAEDAKRRPFVGQAGVLLRRFLEDVSLPPAWITNTVKYKTPRNREPLDAEVELAKPYLQKEWQAVGKPRCIITLGNTPLKAVTGSAGILKRAGALEMWQAADGDPIYLWPMIHPSFGVRNPGAQPMMARHWSYLRSYLDATYR